MESKGPGFFLGRGSIWATIVGSTPWWIKQARPTLTRLTWHWQRTGSWFGQFGPLVGRTCLIMSLNIYIYIMYMCSIYICIFVCIYVYICIYVYMSRCIYTNILRGYLCISVKATIYSDIKCMHMIWLLNSPQQPCDIHTLQLKNKYISNKQQPLSDMSFWEALRCYITGPLSVWVNFNAFHNNQPKHCTKIDTTAVSFVSFVLGRLGVSIAIARSLWHKRLLTEIWIWSEPEV